MLESPFSVEMNFCRRCGSKLVQQDFAYVYKCEQGHTLFLSCPPSAGAVLYTKNGEIVLLKRAIDPGKGMLTLPGGFCPGPERAEDALAREIEEEAGLSPADYTTPEFLLSHVDPYAYKGEVLPVLASIFVAHIKGEVLLTAGDDAAEVVCVRLEDVNMDDIHFPAVRAALELIRDQQAT